VLVETGAFLKTAHEVGDVVIGVFSGRPVYLREVAEIATRARNRRNTCFFTAPRAKKNPP
jgi:multidrug efflux pump subunit AcrB